MIKMIKKYAIWDKVSPVLVPTGQVFTAEQWMEKYPAAKLDHITIICAAGEVNGAFYSTLGQLVDMYDAQGCDFSNCITPEEKLAAIEAFDEAKAAAAAAAAEEAANTPSTDERIAAALEYQVMASLPDEEADDTATEEV